MFASGQATSIGWEESLESRARADARASEMKAEWTFHSGKTLTTESDTEDHWSVYILLVCVVSTEA